MDGTIYRFAQCEVDPRTREIRTGGRLQALEPRPFDLLTFLLRHRDRTVRTDELLECLWREDVVAPGSVANAIAKVRRAIDDRGEPPLIRTVHRVGYQFASDVVEVLPPDRLQPAPLGGAALPQRVALLPFENLTGSPSLDWVSLGLMSLVCQALSQDSRLAPVPVPMVVAALQRVDPRADAAARALAVQRSTGAQHVALTRVRRSAQAYVLDCRLLFPGGEAEGVLHAPDATALGRALARWLQERIDPSEVALADRRTGDAWAAEVLAHALEACARREWERAQTMLTVVLDIEPAHVMARLEWLRARARLCEAQGRFGAALDLWREAAERARAAQLHGVAVRSNGQAALAAAMCGLAEEALARAEDGVAHAQARGDRGDLWRSSMLACQVRAMVGLPVHPPVPDSAEDAADLPEEVRAAWWAAQAYSRVQRGDSDGADAAFAEAVGLYQAIGAAGREGWMLMWWLHVLLESGRLPQAERQLQLAESCGRGQGLILRGLPWLRARLLDAKGDRAGAMACLKPVMEGAAQDLGHAAATALAARWAAQEGRQAEAAAMLARIGPGFSGHPLVRSAAGAIVDAP
ncbi:winged helix-turn-helix domain-containing protein [Ideonella sp. YS5]|uniref:winged helix-turn-helix domain-containing protein n=1 Tax=Ideonella sp. YS5 TaxID=3453714 RepID=UPI003EEB0C56